MGYDYYCIDESLIYHLLIFARDHKLQLSHFQKHDHQFYFYLPVYQRYYFKKWTYPYHYIKTEGLLKYIFLLSRQHLNFIGVLFFFISLFMSSYLIFDIQIDGTLPQVNQSIKGMIQSLDVKSGNIMVKKNDYVKKGDLLVENTIISTQNKTKIIPVEGHVYGYTFHQYEASVKDLKQDQGDVFYQLLLKIRSQIPAGAHIDKENVLQMTRNRSKITLKMHYTLIEDIAVKGEKNEENLKTRNMHDG